MIVGLRSAPCLAQAYRLDLRLEPLGLKVTWLRSIDNNFLVFMPRKNTLVRQRGAAQGYSRSGARMLLWHVMSSEDQLNQLRLEGGGRDPKRC